MVAHDHICWGGSHEHADAHRLSVEGVTARYGQVVALDDITFSTVCGHTLALVGPNGAGKSTLLRLMAGLMPLTRGSITWNGQPLQSCPHEIAYLPQRSDVDWSFPLTVRDLVEMGRYPSIGIWGKFSRHDREIVDKALDSLNLNELRNRQIGALSGGQQQRAFLARAIAQEAHLLLLDEPFTGLDLPSTETLGGLLRSLAAEGRLIIASHHDLNSAPLIFDQTLLLNRQVIAFGDTRQVLTPAHISRAFHKEDSKP